MPNGNLACRLTGDFVSEETTTRGGPTAGDPEKITIPDLLGVGFAFRPNERLTLAADVNFITYSDLDPTPFDDLASVAIRGRSGETLARIVQEMDRA